jgi:hypothetical protein
MDDQGIIDTLDKLIESDRKLIKWSLISAIGLFIIGLVVSTVILFISLPSPETQDAAKTESEVWSKYLFAIPPLFTTFLTTFPIKEYFAKKRRITTFELLQQAYKSPPVSEKIEERFLKVLDGTLA